MSDDRLQLKFASPIFNDGLNLTVRRGSKWHGHQGEMVEVVGLDGEVYGQTQVRSSQLRRFADILQRDLDYEHDPLCRTYQGLLDDMRIVYDGFEEDEVVTLLWFEWKEGD